MGSAHHQPTVALAPSPTSSTAESEVHNQVWALSATTVGVPIAVPVRCFAIARMGITTSDAVASAMPAKEL